MYLCVVCARARVSVEKRWLALYLYQVWVKLCILMVSKGLCLCVCLCVWRLVCLHLQLKVLNNGFNIERLHFNLQSARRCLLCFLFYFNVEQNLTPLFLFFIVIFLIQSWGKLHFHLQLPAMRAIAFFFVLKKITHCDFAHLFFPFYNDLNISTLTRHRIICVLVCVSSTYAHKLRCRCRQMRGMHTYLMGGKKRMAPPHCP
jgi:hypothetical protein